MGTAGEGRPDLALMGENCRGRPDSDGSSTDETLGVGFGYIKDGRDDVYKPHSCHLYCPRLHDLLPLGVSYIFARAVSYAHAHGSLTPPPTYPYNYHFMLWCVNDPTLGK